MQTKADPTALLARDIANFLNGAGVHDVAVQQLPWEEGDTPTCALLGLGEGSINAEELIPKLRLGRFNAFAGETTNSVFIRRDSDA